MENPAFAVNTVTGGMFSSVKVGQTKFCSNEVVKSNEDIKQKSNTVHMAVDAFQRKFQSIGKIGIDYSRPKKLATYKRCGYSVGMEFPNSKAMAGHYSLTACGQPGGSDKILMKYDEFCAKNILRVYKQSGVPYGEYTTKCTEGTVPLMAYETRVFNRTQAFKQAQKPINIRLKEQYATRKACFSLAHNCSREEEQFKNMPMSAASYYMGKMESLGTCIRNVRPSTKEEDYMAGSVQSQLYQKKFPFGTYGVGQCEDGFAQGDADTRRVIGLASEYRMAQASAATITGQMYASASMARQLFTHDCHHEETQVCEYPSVAAALCGY